MLIVAGCRLRDTGTYSRHCAADGFDDELELIELPEMIGVPSRTAADFSETTSRCMHRVSLGVAEVSGTMEVVVEYFVRTQPVLFAALIFMPLLLAGLINETLETLHMLFRKRFIS